MRDRPDKPHQKEQISFKLRSTEREKLTLTRGPWKLYNCNNLDIRHNSTKSITMILVKSYSIQFNYCHYNGYRIGFRLCVGPNKVQTKNTGLNE